MKGFKKFNYCRAIHVAILASMLLVMFAGCDSNQIPQFAGDFKMRCEHANIPGSYDNMIRCEDDKVTCYENSHGAIYCLQKEAGQ